MEKKAFILIAAFLFLAGCGGGRAVPPPETSVMAAGLNERAEAAFKGGKNERALALYAEALRIHRSVENAEGIAINLINLAAVNRRMENREAALKHLDEMLEPGALSFGSSRMSEAAFLKSLLLLDAEKTDASSEWLGKAFSYCEAPRTRAGECGMEGKLYNVEARISLLKKDFTGSASAAERALGFNRASGDGEEEANSLRLLAEAKAAVGLYDEALALYEEALSVDKALGLSRKIALDLMGAGAALLDKGDPAGAKRYFERALSVSEAGGAEDIKGEASSRLQEAGGR